MFINRISYFVRVLSTDTITACLPPKTSVFVKVFSVEVEWG